MKRCNRLGVEASPYLLQHADNPVHWFPWGTEAREYARREDIPIFLSIGYSTCHWCHVMAVESFSDDAVAALLNQWFVAIKVDREERPDIDEVYMAMSRMLTGSGGWPLSVFLFPDGAPFHAATYLPPYSQAGQTGFTELLQSVHAAWRTKRPELRSIADSIVSRLQAPVAAGQLQAAEALAEGTARLAASYDAKWGGFGQAPKFPLPSAWLFLLHRARRTGNRKVQEMVLETLKAMAHGGIHDHLGGGFHRYAVDGRWRVPHFEKMLSDQAQLAQLYLDGYLLSGSGRLAAVAEAILDYVLEALTDAQTGGFHTAEDADSDDPHESGRRGEGRYYLWTEEELVRALGRGEATLFNYCHGVRFEGNVPSDPEGTFSGRNILYRAHADREAAERFHLSEEEVARRLASSRMKLRARRRCRTRPQVDDSVIAAWNGLMIGSMARGGAVLGRADFIRAAEKAAVFIQTSLTAADGVLLRRWRRGKAGVGGMLIDYACLVSGLLDLFQVQQRPDLLFRALHLAQRQNALFTNGVDGGFFDGEPDPGLPGRARRTEDGAEPSANAVAAMNLLRLAVLTGESSWLELARKTVAGFAPFLQSRPASLPAMLRCLDRMERGGHLVVLATCGRDAFTDDLLGLAWGHYVPAREVLLADGGVHQAELARLRPDLAGCVAVQGAPTLYRCVDGCWSGPVTRLECVQQALAQDTWPVDDARSW